MHQISVHKARPARARDGLRGPPERRTRTGDMTGEEGREVLRFVLAAHQSARLGRNVKVADAV